MAQGFKGKKAVSSSTKPRKPQQPKKGARTIAPKKSPAVAAKLQRQKVSKSANADLEKLMVNRSDGKLSIMKNLKDDKEPASKGKKAS